MKYIEVILIVLLAMLLHSCRAVRSVPVRTTERMRTVPIEIPADSTRVELTLLPLEDGGCRVEGISQETTDGMHTSWRYDRARGTVEVVAKRKEMKRDVVVREVEREIPVEVVRTVYRTPKWMWWSVVMAVCGGALVLCAWRGGRYGRL